MKGRGSAALWLAGILAAAGVVRADFVAPAEGPVPFRRDRLPLDTDSLHDLSAQTLALAGKIKPADPASQRVLAQVVALALAIDPGNRPARTLLEELEQGGRELDASVAEAAAAETEIRGPLTWLGSREAGEDANALADCLGDLLVEKPGQPDGEKGAWKGWVAELASFQEKKPVEDPVPPTATGGETLKKEPETVPLAAADILIPIWKRNGMHELASVKISATRTEPAVGAKLTLTLTGDKKDRLANFLPQIRSSLAPRVGDKLAGVTGALSLGEGDAYDFAASGNAISGAAATLLDASIGGDIPPRVVVFAGIGPKGELELPPHPWETLHSMETTVGLHLRVVVPKAAAEYLTAMMAYDGPAFFFNHEVLLAEDVPDLCRLTKAHGPPLEEVSTRFEEVQKAGGNGKTLLTFLANPATVTRLEDISKAMPNHASARLLALQGSGNRPRYLPRKVLAQEIRTALSPLRYAVDTPLDKLEAAQLERLHEQSRQALEKLSPFVDSSDRDLPKEAVAAADLLRTLARALKANDSQRATEVQAKRREAYQVTGTALPKAFSRLDDEAHDWPDAIDKEER